MKTQVNSILPLLMILLLSFSSCKTTEDRNSIGGMREDISKKEMVDRNIPATTMAELLRRQPSLNVAGSGNNIQVRIRGARSFNSTNNPLYIVEGRRMGHEYSTIAAIAPQDVQRINVIRDPAELSSYGVGASNGVIEIFLKK